MSPLVQPVIAVAVRALARAVAGVRGRWWRTWWLAGLGAGALAGAEPERLAGVDDQWRCFRSPNFELYSRNDEAASRELLHHLELLRAEFVGRFKVVERARLEVTVYFFAQPADFRAYAPATFASSDFFRGFYIAGPDRAMISVAPIEQWDDSQRLIFHEYVHHLFRAMEQDPPVWFNEGVAELLAGTRVERGNLEIGHPHARRIAVLREEKLMPLETLFAVDHDSPIYRSDDHNGLFYAESWALLHYWYFGDSGLSKDAVARFLRVASDRKLAAAVNLRAFFRECFAMDYPEMLRRLDRYVSSGSYHFGREPLPAIEPATTYAMRSVPRDELRLRLAELAVRVNRAPEARLALREAADRTPPDPRVLEALGADALVEQDEIRARERWEEALAAGSHNAATYRELTLLEGHQWFDEFHYDLRLPAATADRLRERLRRAIAFEPEQNGAYQMLAWVEAYADQPNTGNVNLVQRHAATVLHQDRTTVALALVRVHLGKPDEAREILAQLEAVGPDAWSRRAAEQISAKLDGRLPNLGSAVRSQNERSVEFDPNDRSRLKVPSVELPPKP